MDINANPFQGYGMGSSMKIGSLCTGYGGLDLAVEKYFAAETIWCAEFDKYASRVIDQRFQIPNYGDIKNIKWESIPKIDILTAGYPCQPFSHAGYRKGTDDERHIFPFILEAISIIRPRWVVLENVRGHLSLGLKEVVASLTAIGYDTKWELVSASEVGAPHKRARVFIIAYPSSEGLQRSRDKTNDIANGVTFDPSSQFESHNRQMPKLGGRFIARFDMPMQTPPDTLDERGRVNPQFVEYMMGIPKGWVTDIDISRSQQIKILGNGVVPQQAYHALQLMLGDTDE
jgi:DNA (cytosine-5)-methyltransferase 1